MDRLPFSAFLLLLVGVIALSGWLSGNLDAWLRSLAGAPVTEKGVSPPPVQPTATTAAYARYSGDARGSAGGRVA